MYQSSNSNENLNITYPHSYSMSIMKDFELDKYSNGLVSNRKSLIRSNYKMTSYCNSSEKRYNVPVPGSNPNPNDNSKDNDNGNLNSLSHMKLPERPNFTTSTISLIVNVPSLSYVNEYIDDDDEDLSNNEMYKLNLNDNQQICPICNTICTELQQQFDDLQLKRSFNEQLMISTIYNENDILHSNNNNNHNHNMIYNRKIEKTPSISIEYVEDNENIFISSNNSQEQLINQKLSDETKNKCFDNDAAVSMIRITMSNNNNSVLVD
ncbi:putative ccaat-box DNA binding protein subunit B [Schistosoma mansoni]|uniref:putative ccaat-box DNA binding protein subunit B n=1 Tax=Schistosoma mansoni TaxID=6183 RepID=UPI0001A64028|nr:putative ccaat-box DNA binding protein subunit B [Schistosoma mansoni]|eukprot:XP_018655563.1 putative ccaat-box DNA binding protein subunit B [Schistosoma mansoni]